MVAYVDIRKSRRGPTQSLKRHLALGFGLFTLLLSAGISFLVGHLARESSTRQAGVHLEQLAADLHGRLDRALYDRYREMRALGQADAGARRSRIEELQQLRPAYSWIAFVDAAGRVVSAAQGAREGEDASGQSWFRRGLDAGVVEFVPAAGGGTNHSIHVAVPVRGPGEKPAGLVVAYLGWDGLGGLRSPLMGPARSLIVGRDGTVLAGTAPARGDPPVLPVSIRAEANRGAWHLERSPDGAEYLAAVSRSSALDYPGPEWRVALFRDAREALSDVGFVQVQIISIGGLLGLAFAGLALWFGARVAEPLTELADAADRLSAGDRALFIPRSSRYAEAERLGASLQSLLSSLRRQEEDLVQARDKLELRVRERSAELVRTRAALEAKIAELERAQRERAPGAPS